MSDVFKQIEDICKRENEIYIKYKIEKNERIQSNVSALKQKSRVLNKPIPDELMAVIYLDMPMGSWFFEKYNEWLN